jgi:hypothetical protein
MDMVSRCSIKMRVRFRNIPCKQSLHSFHIHFPIRVTLASCLKMCNYDGCTGCNGCIGSGCGNRCNAYHMTMVMVPMP